MLPVERILLRHTGDGRLQIALPTGWCRCRLSADTGVAPRPLNGGIIAG